MENKYKLLLVNVEKSFNKFNNDLFIDPSLRGIVRVLRYKRESSKENLGSLVREPRRPLQQLSSPKSQVDGPRHEAWERAVDEISFRQLERFGSSEVTVTIIVQRESLDTPSVFGTPSMARTQTAHDHI